MWPRSWTSGASQPPQGSAEEGRPTLSRKVCSSRSASTKRRYAQVRRMLARKGLSRRRTAESGKASSAGRGRCAPFVRRGVVASGTAGVAVGAVGAAAAGTAGIAAVAVAADAVNRTWRREGAGLLCGAGMGRGSAPFD
ncbi:hypothetical protein STENM327S_07201 [Streptomyces tendae]